MIPLMKKRTSTKYTTHELLHMKRTVDFYVKELSKISTSTDLLRGLLKQRNVSIKICEYALKEIVINGNFFVRINDMHYVNGDMSEVAQVLHLKLNYIGRKVKELLRIRL
ncbi:hypothetical protein THOM_0323 [Trachipleistophora hominis]|uniref:Uncharacterized protein n=1 Tax=Trachipleistophora hominis TaxID=72359 RepID=L7JYR9_TRAHO|nr:hypothetical protein THOM_0323 [Trachipleistophora hominis]